MQFLPLICLIVLFISYCPSVTSSDDDSSKEQPAQVHTTVHYSTPNLDTDGLFKRYFYESFDDEISFNQQWIQSKTTKAESEDLKYDGDWDLVASHSSIKG